MIATLIRPGRFTINLQSHGNRETESDREGGGERERGGLLVWFLSFPLFQTHRDHPSRFFFFLPLSFGGWRMMFIRGSRFSLHYLSPQIDWEHVRKHKSLCTLSQHLHLSIIAGRKCPLSANHCQVSESPFRGSDWVMFFFFCFFSSWLNPPSLTDSHSDLVRSCYRHTKRALHTCVSLFHLG